MVCQGDDWKDAKVAAFFSAKLNSAQQNYATHEIEMLAGVESMLRHADILQGCKFTWITDHKGLIHLMNQKNLSGRQARWIEKTSSFDFKVEYIPGTENVLADALSRIYSNEAPGTVRARSEYTYHNVINNNDLDIEFISIPVFAGMEAEAMTSNDRVTRSKTRAAKAAEGKPFGPENRTLPKEGEGTQSTSSKLPKASPVKPSKASAEIGTPEKRGRGRPRKQKADSPAYYTDEAGGGNKEDDSVKPPVKLPKPSDFDRRDTSAAPKAATAAESSAVMRTAVS
jgi:hypothetical protein